MRPVFLIFLCSLSIALGCNRSNQPADQERSKAYNAILISVDTLRADHLACYGYQRLTAPALERLAKQSILFERAYSQSPWTTPSHASLFTSLYPSVLNLGEWPNPGRIDPKAGTLAEVIFLGIGYIIPAWRGVRCDDYQSQFGRYSVVLPLFHHICVRAGKTGEVPKDR